MSFDGYKRPPFTVDPCLALGPNTLAGWELARYPKCNRPAGHDADHVEYDKRTFAIKASWTSAQIPHLLKRSGK